MWFSLSRCSATPSSEKHSGYAFLICPHCGGCWDSASQVSFLSPEEKLLGPVLSSVWQRNWGCQAPGVTEIFCRCVVTALAHLLVKAAGWESPKAGETGDCRVEGGREGGSNSIPSSRWPQRMMGDSKEVVL